MSGFLSAAAPRTHFERYLTRDDLRRLFSVIRKRKGKIARRDHVWIRVALYSGFRIGSIAGLTVGDAKQALLTNTLRARADHAKRGRAYDIHVSSGLRKALREGLSVRRAMGYPLDDSAAPLFVSRIGKAMAVRSFQHQLKFWRETAGLMLPISAHWLRHTAARRILEKSEHHDPLGQVQSALGHVNRKSTVIYTLPTREDMADAMESICR